MAAYKAGQRERRSNLGLVAQLSPRVLTLAAVGLLIASLSIVAISGWRRLKRAPAETLETRAAGLGALRTRVGREVIFARVSTGLTPSHRPPVVLVHGLVVSSRYMVPLTRALAADFRVYAPDLPGFGESSKPSRTLDLPAMADTLHAWMRTIGLTKVALVGNSFGCQLIAELAVRHPEIVARLVLQGPTVDAAARSLPVQVWRTLWNGCREPPALGLISLTDYAKAGLGRALQTMRVLICDHIEDKLPHITVPTLVVRGSRDPVVPQSWATEMAELLPQGRLLVLEGGTHTLNYTDPERFAAAVKVFLLEGERPAPLAGRALPP
jgi:pimeloyl-ACP methyl ester carboxylesterase